MNKKVMIGASIGVLVLIVAIATVVSAAGTGSLGFDHMDDGPMMGGSGHMNSDCDMNQSRNRDMLRDGSCGTCSGDGPDGVCNQTLNREMVQTQNQLRSTSCIMNGETAGANCPQMGQMGRN